jgi:hypothetical protein
VNTGKPLFAQLMEFLSWSTFARIVARYDGDARVRTLRCAEQHRAMAFAQLTYRESLRDLHKFGIVPPCWIWPPRASHREGPRCWRHIFRR